MSKKIERQINLLSFLLCHRFLVPWSRIRDEFYADIENEETAKRKFERDKEDLRSLGIGIECLDKSEKKEDGLAEEEKELEDIEVIDDLWEENIQKQEIAAYPLYYNGSPRYRVIKENLYLPQINLSIKEKMALYFLGKIICKEEAFHLKDSLRMAVNKLGYDVPFYDNKDIIEAFEKNFTFRLGIKTITDKGVNNLKILDEAVVNSKKAGFRYYSIYKDKETKREIEPYGLMLHSGSWYLVGRCCESNMVKVFKVSRIRGNVKINKSKPKTPDFSIPKDFDIKEFNKKQPWELSDEDVFFEVKIKVNAKYAWFFKGKWGDKDNFKIKDNGEGFLELKVSNIDALIRWVMQFGTGVEVISPESVREKIRQKMRCILVNIR